MNLSNLKEGLKVLGLSQTVVRTTQPELSNGVVGGQIGDLLEVVASFIVIFQVVAVGCQVVDGQDVFRIGLCSEKAYIFNPFQRIVAFFFQGLVVRVV